MHHRLGWCPLASQGFQGLSPSLLLPFPLSPPSSLPPCPRSSCRLKRFNVAFEELAIRQAGWGILDEDARKKARTGLAARIKEAYAQALLPHREVLCDFKAYRYTPNAVERVVLDYFFLGTPTPAPGL